jgi:hypothetical protein
MRMNMSEGVISDSLAGKRRIASYALERDFAPFARSLLWKLGYAVLPAEDVADPELRIVREDRLGEVAKLAPLPLILITDRRQPETGDSRVTGTVRRPAGVPPLYRLLQSALEEHPRSVPRVVAALKARATSETHALDLEVRSLSENGCLLTGPKLPALDTTWALNIEFPWGEKVDVTASISYEQGGSVGALFQSMTLATRERVAKLVARLLDRM